MPFATDTSWPAGLTNIFDIARSGHGSFENRYYGPYNTMLFYYTVDFIVYLIVYRDQRPVFLVEIKDDAHILVPTKRKAADAQMRERYDELLHACPIPMLYGLSVLGTKMRVYCGNLADQTVAPSFVDTDPRYVLPNDYLGGEWSVDIMSQAGFSEMKRMINYIKSQA
ncbi:hypothetical protein B0H14DRAFT_2998956 [Mycena olivaceomarginata]|nr:hypothetical protein B0H14DRAFT_2998956 [Mycena olivaceomarginata]